MAGPNFPINAVSGNYLVAAGGVLGQHWNVFGITLSSSAGATITLASGPASGPTSTIFGPVVISPNTGGAPFAIQAVENILCSTNATEGLWLTSTGTVDGQIYANIRGPNT